VAVQQGLALFGRGVGADDARNDRLGDVGGRLALLQRGFRRTARKAATRSGRGGLGRSGAGVGEGERADAAAVAVPAVERDAAAHGQADEMGGAGTR
jgi:hypothetical protein